MQLESKSKHQFLLHARKLADAKKTHAFNSAVAIKVIFSFVVYANIMATTRAVPVMPSYQQTEEATRVNLANMEPEKKKSASFN